MIRDDLPISTDPHKIIFVRGDAVEWCCQSPLPGRLATEITRFSAKVQGILMSHCGTFRREEICFQLLAHSFPLHTRGHPEGGTETRRGLARILFADASSGAHGVSHRTKKPRRYLCCERF
jgi:hypothetical protein